jgi:hypothetical protein
VQYLSDAFDLKVGEDDMGRWLSTDPGGAVVHVKERQDVSDALGKWSREDTMPWFYRCVAGAEARRRQGGAWGREGGVVCGGHPH